MPNQLSPSKRRYSLCEHEAVLAALSELAEGEDTTVAGLLRRAVRKFLRNGALNAASVDRLRSVVMRFEPKPPESLETAAALRRYKRHRREFDQLLLDLGIDAPDSLNERNSVVPPSSRIRIVELEPRGGQDGWRPRT